MSSAQDKPIEEALFWPEATMNQALQFYEDILDDPRTTDKVIAALGKVDRFFLLTHLLRRHDAIHPWLYDRCREVEQNQDGYLDLWSREHYKSTWITFAGSIQEILNNPNITIGIFSHTRPISKSFLGQIKQELENNTYLKRIYKDILHENPKKDATKWSLDSGICVKRTSNAKEMTVEAHGLVDGQPTGMHFDLLIFDDVVTLASVNTAEMIKKTTDAWDLAQNLGNTKNFRSWHIGTRYNLADSYDEIIKRGAAIPRIYPATDDGTPDGNPVFLSVEAWEKKKRDSSPYTIACLAAGTRIMMSDWSQKPIENIRIGDEVVGVTPGSGGKNGSRVKLSKTKILAVGCRKSKIYEYTLESGKKILSTDDHKWWTGRPLNDSTHKQYNILGFGYRELSGLCRVVDPDSGLNLSDDQKYTAAWLGGMFDGEGSTSNKSGSSYVHITQCPNHNPLVCQALRDALTKLGFDWEEYKRKDGKSASIFRYRGGRAENFRFLQMCNPVKRNRIAKTMYGSRIGYQGSRDKLVNIRYVGEGLVYSLTTGTGNYIAEGCISKNCQQLQNPIAGSEQEMKPEWIRTYEVRPYTLNVYILGDYAGSRKSTGSSKTAIVAIGVDAALNKYLIDGACHKMDLNERWKLIKKLRNKWVKAPGVQTVKIGYERFGAQSDIQHFETMMEIESCHFPIEEVNYPRDGVFDKDNRIRRLIPDFQNWRFFLPYEGDMTSLQRETINAGQDYLISKPIKAIDETKKVYNLCKWLLENEYIYFPHTTQKDLLDAMSRLYDLDPQAPVTYDETDVYPDVV